MLVCVNHPAHGPFSKNKPGPGAGFSIRRLNAFRDTVAICAHKRISGKSSGINFIRSAPWVVGGQVGGWHVVLCVIYVRIYLQRQVGVWHTSQQQQNPSIILRDRLLF